MEKLSHFPILCCLREGAIICTIQCAKYVRVASEHVSCIIIAATACTILLLYDRMRCMHIPHTPYAFGDGAVTDRECTGE